MAACDHLPPDEIRARFSRALSDMYRQEVPKYGLLQGMVERVNDRFLAERPGLRAHMRQNGELGRLSEERHGAIRLGTAQELSTMRRVFAVMGMHPVGYYDLSVAGVPVHSTAFRPIADDALAANPFRVFTSLLRLDLLGAAGQAGLARRASDILSRRRIFTPRALELLALCEARGGLGPHEADEFIGQVRETFRWHGRATVPADTYRSLRDAHRLVADVVCFPGPHINHLTPRTLDIDALQAEMPGQGLDAKEVIEGPPPRQHPILLRQTSFKALEEVVAFPGGGEGVGATEEGGTHAARFGEVEQRGAALTRAGRALYDDLLAQARQASDAGASYAQSLAHAFESFPDDLNELGRRGLAFFRYRLAAGAQGVADPGAAGLPLAELVARGIAVADPITYEDFLPVSAAGIFQSNLGASPQRSYSAQAAKGDFEQALGAPVHDEIALYESAAQRSVQVLRSRLRTGQPM